VSVSVSVCVSVCAFNLSERHKVLCLSVCACVRACLFLCVCMLVNFSSTGDFYEDFHLQTGDVVALQNALFYFSCKVSRVWSGIPGSCWVSVSYLLQLI